MEEDAEPLSTRKPTKTLRALTLEQREQIVHAHTVQGRKQIDVAREFRVPLYSIKSLLRDCRRNPDKLAAQRRKRDQKAVEKEAVVARVQFLSD